MKTEQVTVTFPQHKLNLKRELERQKKQECLNVSAFIVSCVEKELGACTKQHIIHNVTTTALAKCILFCCYDILSETAVETRAS